MKIALAQLNYHIGDFDYNVEKIIETSKKAKDLGAELVVFSELSLCGAFPGDLLHKFDFRKKCWRLPVEIQKALDIPAIVGVPYYCAANPNDVALFINGKDKGIDYTGKKVLFWEKLVDYSKYFSSFDEKDNLFEFNGTKFCLTIGDDIVFIEEGQLPKDVEFIINISANPFSHSRNHVQYVAHQAKAIGCPIINVNQVGANAEVIFEGRSNVINAQGQVLLTCKAFEEDLQIFDTEDFTKVGEMPSENDEIAEIYSALTFGIREYFEKMGFKKAVIGMSGGIDSALVLALAVQALGSENVHSILMPTCYSSAHSVDDSLEMLKRTKSPYNIIPIETLRTAFETTMAEVFEGTKPGLAEENIQARLRGNILMAFSNKFGHILLNTSNKSEEAVGYSTLYGDMCGSLSVLGDVYKTEVYELARYINKHFGNIIPENIITKAPSAELRPDQKDQDSLPPYDILDGILRLYFEANRTAEHILDEGYERETVEFVLKLVKRVEYKRFQAPPILRVSNRPFGHLYQIPLVSKY